MPALRAGRDHRAHRAYRAACPRRRRRALRRTPTRAQRLRRSWARSREVARDSLRLPSASLERVPGEDQEQRGDREIKDDVSERDGAVHERTEVLIVEREV